MTGFELKQQQKQTQVQIMSQKQIQSLELLAMGNMDLCKAVYDEAEKNPAVTVGHTRGPSDYTRVTSSTGAAAELASENFQAALEAKADERMSLQDHLLSQFRSQRMSDAQRKIGERLIYNLNDKGFHILAPESLLDKNDPSQTPALLKETILLIQQLDPVGTCTSGTEESLFAQARLREDAPQSALFILDGHFDFLDPPKIDRIAKKIKQFQKERAQMIADSAYQKYASVTGTEQEAEEALKFIRTLDPFPARNFGSSGTHYIAPDIFIEPLAQSFDADNFDKGIVTYGKRAWLVRLSQDNVPLVTVNPELQKLASKETPGSEKIQENLKQARNFIESIKYRESTIHRACCIIVKKQHEFFEKGPGHLSPLRQSDVAAELGVHETTVSRMANSKFLQCEWGLFDIKYFFTNQVADKADLSRDNILHEIKKILAQNADNTKPLSDQKIADELEKRGIKIARRTVAKYRANLSIESSYTR